MLTYEDAQEKLREFDKKYPSGYVEIDQERMKPISSFSVSLRYNDEHEGSRDYDFRVFLHYCDVPKVERDSIESMHFDTPEEAQSYVSERAKVVNDFFE